MDLGWVWDGFGMGLGWGYRDQHPIRMRTAVRPPQKKAAARFRDAQMWDFGDLPPPPWDFVGFVFFGGVFGGFLGVLGSSPRRVPGSEALEGGGLQLGSMNLGREFRGNERGERICPPPHRPPPRYPPVGLGGAPCQPPRGCPHGWGAGTPSKKPQTPHPRGHP